MLSIFHLEDGSSNLTWFILVSTIAISAKNTLSPRSPSSTFAKRERQRILRCPCCCLMCGFSIAFHKEAIAIAGVIEWLISLRPLLSLHHDNLIAIEGVIEFLLSLRKKNPIAIENFLSLHLLLSKKTQKLSKKKSCREGRVVQSNCHLF